MYVLSMLKLKMLLIYSDRYFKLDIESRMYRKIYIYIYIFYINVYYICNKMLE